MSYKSERKYRIWAYTVSHSSMIIRSEKHYDDVDYPKRNSPNCTIDLEFSGIDFISLPDTLNGIDLRKENGVYRFNENKDHYVIANSCRIGKSQFDYKQDRISDMTLEYDEIVMTL